MKVLFIHNFYKTDSPSGEDYVASLEKTILNQYGIIKDFYEMHNDDIVDSSFFDRVKLALNYVWSDETYNKILKKTYGRSFDVAHIHSLHPQISPSVYSACQDAKIPVVHTLHNYRYLCPGALLQRNNKTCELCIGRMPYFSLFFKCYRNSFSATSAVASMIAYNRFIRTFDKLVNRYIVLTNFAKSRFVAGGFSADKIEVKPNFLPNPPLVSTDRQGYAIFVGRLSQEKGVQTLLHAWRNIHGFHLKIAGEGPLRPELELLSASLKLDVEFLGTVSSQQVLKLVGEAMFQIVPSEWYEGFPMVILEAYACGTPVIASRIGSLEEVVLNGKTGFHFEPGDPNDLARMVLKFQANPELARSMGETAREEFDKKYTAERNFSMLMDIYARAREDFDRNSMRK